MTVLNSLRDYTPLAVVIAVSSLLALVHPGMISGMIWMHLAMGYFMVLLAVLKLFDLTGFKNGFIKYDLVTQKFPVYGFVYPFIELGLGLMYLSFALPALAYVLTIGVMSVAGAGVINSIRDGDRFECACMGNILKVPLSTVSIIENIGMVIMALAMLVLAF